MSQLDDIDLALIGSAALVAAGTFAMIANYRFDQTLADRNDPFTNIVDLYRKYRDQTHAHQGRVDPLLRGHCAAVDVFTISGIVYVILRFD
ncbi:MAG: hypothetical protein QNI88_16390 [Desulfobacterales bacterium]|nr:hypothetical protein [Desulfobacterales bacterium]